MIEKVIRKQTLLKLLNESVSELDAMKQAFAVWMKPVKKAYNKTKKNKIPTSTESVHGILGCIVALKLNEEMPNLKKRIKRLRKMITNKNKNKSWKQKKRKNG